MRAAQNEQSTRFFMSSSKNDKEMYFMKNVTLVGYKVSRQQDPFSENYHDGTWLYVIFDSADVIGKTVQRVWIDGQRYVPNKHVCRFEMVDTAKGGETNAYQYAGNR